MKVCSWSLLGLAVLLCQFHDGKTSFVISTADDAENFDLHSRSRRAAVDIPSNYSAIEIPPSASGPLNVKMSIVIMNLRDIKEIGEEMSIEMNIRIYWKDSRLSHLVEHLVNSPSESNEAEFILLPVSTLKNIWAPDLFIDHVKKVDQPTIMGQTASLRMYPDNTLRYSARLTIIIACPMDFHYYPADTQRCHFDVKSYAYSDKKMVLAWRDKKGAYFGEEIDLPNFFTKLDNPSVFSQKTQSGRSFKLLGNSYSALRFSVLLTRKQSYHLMQTYLPSIVLVVVSWLSFLINIEAAPARTTVLMTCLLTLIAMFSSVRQSTPNVSYVKFIDFWMFTCVLFVFMALMEYTLVLKIKSMKFKSKEPEAAKSLRPASREIVTPVYYPNTVPHRGVANPRALQGQGFQEIELTAYGTPWQGDSGEHGGGTVGDSVPRRPSLGLPGERENYPGMYSRPLPLKPAVPNEPPSPPPTAAPPRPTRNEEIIAKVELRASIIIPFMFVIFCSLYWPWILISSEYFEHAGGSEL